MAYRNTLESYGSVAKFFHWLIAVLVIGMLCLGFFMGDFPKEYKGTIYGLHKLIGVSIFFLMLTRAIWRVSNINPAAIVTIPAFELIASRAVHFTLYFCVIAMSFVGWAGSVAGGKPPMLGSFAFWLPIPADKALSHAAFDVHNALAWIIIGAVVLHTLGAIYHHVIRKDNTLRRMLPY